MQNRRKTITQDVPLLRYKVVLRVINESGHLKADISSNAAYKIWMNWSCHWAESIDKDPPVQVSQDSPAGRSSEFSVQL